MSRNIDRLLDIMARLRDRDAGCPWDLEQTFRTIAPHTIEEAYEVADAIEQDDMPALKDELGDLLFQVVFYAQMAREAGQFDFEAIAGAISDKMIRRHPHVFGDVTVESADAMVVRWEDQKAAEREAKAAADGRAIYSRHHGFEIALDALTRRRMQDELLRLWGETGTTMLFVTHDLDEAVYLADRVVLLGGKPAGIVRDFDVDLARPRERDTVHFADTVRTIRAALSESVSDGAGI